jgi:hypothetical protein
VAAAVGVRIDVVGFDTGTGLPPLEDERDLPYAWRSGLFASDPEQIRAALRRAQLVVGDVRDTVHGFLAEDGPPLGFVAFDLDLYSSTIAALELLECGYARLLPRVLCFFDNVVGLDDQLHSPYAGELLAIDAFNDRHADRKLAQVNGQRHKRILPAAWNDQLYALHCFGHPDYARYVRPRR